MPTVLITGISGFLATHVTQEFLENGWNVRGTVRSAEKGEAVKKLPVFAKHADQISYVIVEDLVSGDFSEAVKGVDAVAHLASPWHFNGKSWQEDYRDPAVKGTKSVLEAAAKVDSIKHVVVTSSFAAVGDFSKPATEQAERVYTEKDWNPAGDDYCESLKADDPMAAMVWYCASKARAEEQAVEIAKNAKYTLATMCPPMIFGPPLQKVTSLDSLDTATASIYSLFDAEKVPEAGFPAYADARDVARAHYQAIARGLDGRFLLCGGNYSNQEFCDFLHDERPDLAARIPRGEPGKYVYNEPGVFKLDTSKAEKELGLKWTPVKTTLLDVVDRLVELEKELKN